MIRFKYIITVDPSNESVAVGEIHAEDLESLCSQIEVMLETGDGWETVLQKLKEMEDGSSGTDMD